MNRQWIGKVLFGFALMHAASGNALSIGDDAFQYAGQYTDCESGLQYLNARYYDPAAQRFISRDSYQLLNRYTYASGNPITFADPSGHFSMPSLESMASMVFGIANMREGLVFAKALKAAPALLASGVIRFALPGNEIFNSGQSQAGKVVNFAVGISLVAASFIDAVSSGVLGRWDMALNDADSFIPAGYQTLKWTAATGMLTNLFAAGTGILNLTQLATPWSPNAYWSAAGLGNSLNFLLAWKISFREPELGF